MLIKKKQIQNMKKKNNKFTLGNHPLMMAYERSKSAWDNFSKFIYQLPPKIKTLVKKLERILIELYKQSCLYYLIKHA